MSEKPKLRKLFENHLETWKKEKPTEIQRLVGGLMFYGSIIPVNPNTTLWDILQEQIQFQAKKHKKTPEEFINFLFRSKNHDIFMARLQM